MPQEIKGTFSITKRYEFEASHKLPWHQGKCGRDHGHSYILDLTIAGEVKPDNGDPDAGMVMDFYDVGKVVKPLIEDKFDHHNINELMQNPTAERMVEWLARELKPQIPGLCKIRLFETRTGWVEFTFAN